MKQLGFSKLLFLIFLSVLISIIFAGCKDSNSGLNTDQFFSVSYNVSEGGYFQIDNNPNQTVLKGNNTEKITVIPYDGYKFIKWSDGLVSTTRQEINVQTNLTLTAIFEKEFYLLTYTANVGGKISDEFLQSIEYGKDGKLVTAVPDDGYLFAGWSDGILNETRHDKKITSDIEISATFTSKIKTLKYQYNNATANNSQKQIVLTYDSINEASFIIPQKNQFVFNGWYLDSEFTIRVTDENGFYYLGYNIFYCNSDCLYAKWTVTETTTFKILMVFVDEVNAQLKTAEGIYVDVNYKMSLIERKICELIPSQISKHLNSWFEGLINFEIDTYFTTVPLGSEAFSLGVSSTGRFNYNISAIDIEEVGLLLKNYRSVIATFSMNDYDSLLKTSAGSASTKYACIHMEMFLNPLRINNIPYESYLDLTFESWETLTTVYIHEFTHTVEQGLGVYEYHEIVSHYWNQISELETTRLYLLNQAIIDDETVGIPYCFWKGEIDVPVNYLPNVINGWDAGRIVIVGATEGNTSNAIYKKIPFGSSITVEAIPFEGYKFLKWSDGVTTAIRNDVNVISYLNVTAIFVKG